MTDRQPSRTTPHQMPRILIVGLLVISAAIGAALGYQLQAFSSPAAASPIATMHGQHRGASPAIVFNPPQPPGPQGLPSDSNRKPGSFPPLDGGQSDAAAPGPPGAVAPGGRIPRIRPQRGVSSEADGVVPDGTTVFDDETPGIARLNPALLGALRQAAKDAANDGARLYVTSGWRSPAYQRQLLREAVAEYGSETEAARWVATAETSPHVSGDAVDLGPADATAWLSKHGSRYALCQIYRNEPWHYELRPHAISRGCPPMYADPTQDPRMRQ